MAQPDVVIVSGNGVGSPFALIHSIAQKVPCRVFLLCSDDLALKTFRSSRYVTAATKVVDETIGSFLDSIDAWYRQVAFETPPILYLTSDLFCRYVAEQREWFEKRFVLSLPSNQIVEQFTVKGVAETVAERAGLLAPKTAVIKTEEDLHPIAGSFSFPLILKPQAYHLRKGINFKIRVVEDDRELVEVAAPILQSGHSLLVQEYIPGGDESACFYLFYRGRQGEIISLSGVKTLQSDPKGGIMAIGTSCYDEELDRLSRNFLKEIDYRGIGGIEFKKDRGRYFFIEMSVRPEGFLKIAEISGVPLSLYSYYDLSPNDSEKEKLKPIEQREGMIYVDWFSSVVRRLVAKEFLLLIKESLALLFQRRRRANIYDKSDWRPFWVYHKSKVTQWISKKIC